MVNMDTGEVMLDKNGTDIIFPASMTKMMTVIVAIENNKDLSEKITITHDIINRMVARNASMAGFSAYDEVSLLDLCYGALLPSGAECTECLALYTCGNVDDFVELMNEKAKSLYMMNTHFMNTTGLHHPDHYSTCYDMSLLLRYCWNNETFRKIFCTPSYVTEPVASHPEGLLLRSTSLLFAEGSHIVGAKTGFTIPAGRCLASVSKGNETYALIVAHSPDGYIPSCALTDSIAITDYMYDHYEMKTFVQKDELLESVFVKYVLKDEYLDITSDHDLTFTYPKGSTFEYHINELEAPLNKGDIIGNIEIKNGDTILYEEPIYCPKTIETNDFIIKFYEPLYTLKLHPEYGYYGLIGCVLMIGIIVVVWRRKK